MVSYLEALEKINEKIQPIKGKEYIELLASTGYVLAEDVISSINNPPFNSSAMDGYAVKFDDLTKAKVDSPVTLNIIEDIPAGTFPKKSLSSGEASRIMTGAPIPKGADAVIMQEYTKDFKASVEIFKPVKLSENIRLLGEDIKKGDVALKKGDLIRHQEIAMLAMLGLEKVPVFRRPRVSIITTGSELVSIDEEITKGKIRDVNSFMLASLLKSTGAVFTNYGIVPDTKEEVNKKVGEALKSSDILLITGGVSVGKYDFVKETLSDLGISSIFWRISMKPGKPVLFASNTKKYVFGLPGNPMSTYTGFNEFVLPAIEKMMHKKTNKNYFEAKLTEDILKDKTKKYFIFAVLDDDKKKVKPILPQGSGMLTPSHKANAVIVINEGVKLAKKGESVSVREI